MICYLIILYHITLLLSFYCVVFMLVIDACTLVVQNVLSVGQHTGEDAAEEQAQ